MIVTILGIIWHNFGRFLVLLDRFWLFLVDFGSFRPILGDFGRFRLIWVVLSAFSSFGPIVAV